MVRGFAGAQGCAGSLSADADRAHRRSGGRPPEHNATFVGVLPALLIGVLMAVFVQPVVGVWWRWPCRLRGCSECGRASPRAPSG